MKITVIIPTYNPDPKRLEQALSALKQQSLPTSLWELLIIDNNSSNNFHNQLDLSWHPSFRIITEKRQGLTYARVSGFEESKGEFIVMVDDDNLLGMNYLRDVSHIFAHHPLMGSIGGRSLPLFESVPPEWLNEFYRALALRDIGDKSIVDIWHGTYPEAAPIGAGMAIRKTALIPYINLIRSALNPITDRTATSLTSGGDNEINIELLKAGWQVGYFPELILQHMIPKERMQPEYLARLVHDTNKSWMVLLNKHGINPWDRINITTLFLRRAKAYLSCQAWKNDVNFIKWRAACGIFEGLTAAEY
jgi:glycosyltransferase involved in cell wall biosynthesis